MSSPGRNDILLWTWVLRGVLRLFPLAQGVCGRNVAVTRPVIFDRVTLPVSEEVLGTR